MQNYMQDMADILNGTPANSLSRPAHQYIDPKFAPVYRNNSVSAFADVLRANYMSVEALVGREYFSTLALKYIKDHPCHARTLVGYGAGFSHILGGHALPYLSSFATLDRAWTQAHIAADAPSLELDSFVKSLGPNDDLLDQYLLQKPDVQIVKNQWPVFNIWTKLRDGHELGESIKMEQGGEIVLLWRYDNEVLYRVLNTEEFAFLNAIRANHTLGEACTAVQEITPELDINNMLVQMINANIFTDHKICPTGERND